MCKKSLEVIISQSNIIIILKELQSNIINNLTFILINIEKSLYSDSVRRLDPIINTPQPSQSQFLSLCPASGNLLFSPYNIYFTFVVPV